MVKVAKSFINTLAVMCYIIIFAIALTVAPMIMGYRPMVVLSGSMVPTYDVGSLIYLKETPFDELEVGDVITFGSQEDGLVSHRIVDINKTEGTLTTKGDANDVNDPEIKANIVKGRISDKLYIPYAGYILQMIRKPVIIIGLALILIVKIMTDNLVEKHGSKTQEQSA